MKYLIEIPDETGQAYYNIAPYTNKNDELYWTDGYEKGVEAGRDDAWEFVMRCLKMNGNDFYEIFNSCDALCLTNLSYREAKAKYEAWKESKEEIRVGDEVTSKFGDGVVIDIVADEAVHILGKDGHWNEYADGEYRKTGRHFNQVEELLKKIREE